MKKIIYSIFAVAFVAVAIVSCDNGNSDFAIVDVAPVISISDPGNVIQGADVSIAVDFTDGTENLSQSTLAAASYDLSNGTASVSSGTFSVSGRTASGTVSVQGGLAAGNYTLTVTATDSNGNSGSETFTFEVTSDFTVGIIGSATPTGWDSDTDMNFVTGTQYELTIDLTAGEAKFRSNDDWGQNWGDGAFPAGTGTQDGANIPIGTAATYLVTFDTSTGAYTFTAQ